MKIRIKKQFFWVWTGEDKKQIELFEGLGYKYIGEDSQFMYFER